MLSSARSRPLQLESPVSEWDLQETDVNQIDAVGRVYRAQAFIENSDGEIGHWDEPTSVKESSLATSGCL